MAAARHLLITAQGGWTGSLFGLEEWQFGIKCRASVGSPTQAQIDTMSNNIFTALRARWATLGTNIGVLCQLRSVKVAVINTAGHYEQAPGISNGTVLSGTGTTTLPGQNAVVATTIANSVFRGLGRYGRFYIPGVSSSAISSTTGGLTSAAQTAFATFTAGYVNDLQGITDWVSAPLEPAHFPQGVISPVIDEIRVGDVVDTQRRRRNAVLETYVSVAV